MSNIFRNYRILLIFSALIIFTANINLAADEDYLIGVGDVVRIDFLGARYMTTNFTVDNNGFISIPVFGKYYINSKTLKFVELELTRLFEKNLNNPGISVSLIKSYKDEQLYQNRQVFDKLEDIKSFYLDRNYSQTITEIKNLLDIIVKISERDSEIRGTSKYELELTNCNYKLSGGINNIYEIVGKLRNNVSTPFIWVKLKITFISVSNKILSVRENFIIKDAPIYQTQIVPFEFKGIAPIDAVKIEMSISDYLIANSDSPRAGQSTGIIPKQSAAE